MELNIRNNFLEIYCHMLNKGSVACFQTCYQYSNQRVTQSSTIIIEFDLILLRMEIFRSICCSALEIN